MEKRNETLHSGGNVMISTIKTYWEVYKKFISTSTTMAMSFRLPFVLLIIMDLCFYFTTLTTVDFIFNHIEHMGPWNRDQLMFFISFMLLLDNLHMTFISESFWELSMSLKTGQFDYIVLRPMNTLFSTFFRFFRPSTMLNFPIALGVLIFYGLKIQLTTLAWFTLPFLVILSFILLIQIEFIITTSMFWMIDGLGINFLRMQFQKLARWPHFIYASLPRRVFTIVFPILIIGSAPTHFLIDQKTWPWLLALVIAILACGFVLSILWKKGISRYESASS